MEEAWQGGPGLRSRDLPASAYVDPVRAEASADSPAGGGGEPPEGSRQACERHWWHSWFGDQKKVASDRKQSTGNPHGPSLAKYLEEKKTKSAAEKRDSIDLEWQHLEQDEPGNRSYLTAGRARSWTKLESELQVLRSSTHPLALEFLQTLEKPIQIIVQLLTENQQLQQKQQQDRSQNNQVAQLLAENQQLRQELQELKSGQMAPIPQRAPCFAANRIQFPWNKAFPVQLWTTGHTNGCEKQFMDDVTRLLAGQGISLQVANYQENSEQFLLLFCPVASRSGTDVNNALEGLSSMRKTLLVVCHYKPKSNSQPFVRLEVRHPALVTTVHACYTLQDGFYHCQMNTEAMTAMAAAIVRELRGD